MKKQQYLILSKLFLYPSEGYKEDVEDCRLFLEKNYPVAATSFERFADFIASKKLYEIEEVFGITFHIQSICYLDVGYVLFGEDYARGEFLRQMKNEQAKIGHDCSPELDDNLPHVLQLMSISNDDEFIQELAVRAVIPAVEKMSAEFQESRMKWKQKVLKKKQKAIIMEDVADGNIYHNAIQTLLLVLQKDFEGIQYDNPEVIENDAFFGNNTNATTCGSCSIVKNNPIKTVRT